MLKLSWQRIDCSPRAIRFNFDSRRPPCLSGVSLLVALPGRASDGRRPAAVVRTPNLINRPVDLTVEDVWSGTVPGHLVVRALGGSVGCDQVVTDRPQLTSGEYLVTLALGRTGNSATLGSPTHMAWWPVNGGVVQTPADGAIPLAAARQLVSQQK
jgi:hypothetical protein